jgi:CHAT domain-containing protein
VRLPVGGSTLADEVEELRRPMLAPWSLGTLSFDVALAERLREQIFDPLTPFLNDATRLIIVPDGPLHRLPFEALVLGSGEIRDSGTLYGMFKTCEFVGDRYAIVYLPSSCLPAFPSGDQPDRGGASSRRDLLAFGNPRIAQDRSELGGGGALVHSEREVRALEPLFADAVLCVGDAATELQFKRLAPNFRYLHISSHGVADEATPLYSGLQLALDPGGREDGFLHAHEVLSLPLSCDLVTLSACRTGLGRLYAGEGLIGLTRSFLYAGAEQVLVSLWSVNDASTAILMGRFYANLKEGWPASEALQEAKAALRATVSTGSGGRQVAYAHPFFWAPFVLVGAPEASPGGVTGPSGASP